MAGVDMCLLKVYVEDGEAGRRLVARDVAFVTQKGGLVRLRDADFEEVTLRDVDMVTIDALSSILILKRR
jgi:hypothetical protein